MARGGRLPLRIAAAQQLQVQVRLYSAGGKLAASQSLLRDGDFLIPADIAPGLYILQAANGRETASAKIVVK